MTAIFFKPALHHKPKARTKRARDGLFGRRGCFVIGLEEKKQAGRTGVGTRERKKKEKVKEKVGVESLDKPRSPNGRVVEFVKVVRRMTRARERELQGLRGC